MKEGEELSLINKYSNLFSSSFYGFEVPSGWAWIVEKYLEKTQWDVEKNRLNISIIQIKEKFAQLRIYTNVVDDVLGLDAENRAYCEALADHTCENCGCLTRDKQYTKGWIVGLCPECYKEKEAEVRNTIAEY